MLFFYAHRGGSLFIMLYKANAYFLYSMGRCLFIISSRRTLSLVLHETDTYSAPWGGSLFIQRDKSLLYSARPMYVSRSSNHIADYFPPKEVDHVSFTYTCMLRETDHSFFWSLPFGSFRSGIGILDMIQSSISSILDQVRVHLPKLGLLE